MKQILAYSLVICIVTILNSCTESTKEKEIDALLVKTPPFLYSLSLENTKTNAWFDTLMQRAKRLQENGQGRKGNLVFRFIHDADGSLSLVASIGGKNRRNWDTTFFKFESYDCGGTIPTMNNKKVLLGNLEIDDFTSKIDTLLTIASNHVDYQYVFFKPNLIYQKSTDSYTIRYDIDFGAKPSDMCGSGKFVTGTFQANPSPPKNGN